MVSSAKTSREEKRRFFDELDQLGESEEEGGNEEEVRNVEDPVRSKNVSILEKETEGRVAMQGEDVVDLTSILSSTKSKSSAKAIVTLPEVVSTRPTHVTKPQEKPQAKPETRHTRSTAIKPVPKTRMILPESISDHRSSTMESQGKSKASRTRSANTKPVLKTAATLPEMVTSSQRDVLKCQEKPRTSNARSENLKPVTGRGKVKGKDEIQYVPEDQRIFNDMRFFFVPNNDVTKPRKKRIQAGISRGATWIRAYSDIVTHVVVDIDLDFTSVAKAFKDRVIPEGAILVKDTWLIDSIKYGYVQNDAASRYRLKGAPEAVHGEKRPRAADPDDGHESPKAQKRKVGEDQQQETPLQTSTKPEDDLDRIIQEFQNNKHILPDLETDSVSFLDHSVTESSLEEISGDDSEQQEPIYPTENRGFQCMEKNYGRQDNPNARTIEILQRMASYYDRTGDRWRTLSYRKGMTALGKQACVIKTREEALRIPGIGARLADKIEEIVTTDRLRRLDNAEKDPNDIVLQLFMGIYDVGYKQASTWIAQGHRSLEDLTEKVNLTPNQKIGIERYTNFQQRIPRGEVALHGEIVEQALLTFDPHFQSIIGGSYRRGASTSGDIDILITKRDADLSHIRTLVTDSVIPLLHSQSYLKASLTSSSPTTSKFHGAACLPGSTTWRRIDLLYVPWMSYGAALIYFTGNDIFNRSMRLLASRKGWTLNQHGLFKDVMRGKERKKVTDGTLIEGHNERKIFNILGVPWRRPDERIC